MYFPAEVTETAEQTVHAGVVLLAPIMWGKWGEVDVGIGVVGVGEGTVWFLMSETYNSLTDKHADRKTKQVYRNPI